MTAEATAAPETTSKRWENLGPRLKDFSKTLHPFVRQNELLPFGAD